MSAIATKDHLLSLLNGANDIHELVSACEKITIVLANTLGFWQELRYCYKGKEIAERCVDELNHYMMTCQHHKTLGMLAGHRDTLRALAELYHLHQEQSMKAA